MLTELLKHPRALLLSLAFHALLVTLIIVNITFSDKPQHPKAGPVAQTVKAEVVDSKQLEQLQKQKQLDADKKREAIKKQKELAAKRQREAKAKRVAEAKKKAELKRKLEAEKKRNAAKLKAEQKRKADARRKAEEKRKAAAKRRAEEKRLAEEKRQAEAARLAAEQRKADAAKKVEAERKRQQAEQRRRAEQEQLRRENDLQAKLQAEENQRRLDSVRQAYILAIRQKVERNWRKPAGSGKMPVCEVHVLQGPGGIILDVTFGDCGGSTATYRASIENAVYKAEPLPKPGDPDLFERELTFLFNPSEQ